MFSSSITITMLICKESCFYFVPFIPDYFHTLLWVSINHPKPILKKLLKSAVMSPYLFPTRKGTVPFTSFRFLESFAFCVPLSALLRMGFSQNENIIL